jgi:hypothetical protein
MERYFSRSGAIGCIAITEHKSPENVCAALKKSVAARIRLRDNEFTP